MNLETFFKNNYKAMVRYCTFDFDKRDVEEVVSDVICNHYQEYLEQNGCVKTTRRWLNRRVILNLRAKRLEFTKREYVEFDDFNHNQREAATPENVLCLKQRLPKVLDILVEYETYGPEQTISDTRQYTNTNSVSERNKFYRAKKKFLEQLAA